MQAQRISNNGHRDLNKGNNTFALSVVEKLSVMEALDHLCVARQYQELGSCFICKKITIKKCQGCSIFYCSIECQTFDWPKHRNTCSRHQDNVSDNSSSSSKRLQISTSLKNFPDDLVLEKSEVSPFRILARQLSKNSGFTESRSATNLKIGNRQYQSRGRHSKDESGNIGKDFKKHSNERKKSPAKITAPNSINWSPQDKKNSATSENILNNDEDSKVTQPIEYSLDYKVTTPKCLFDLSLEGDIEVVGTYRESANRYWVMEVKNKKKLEEIQEFLNKNCKNFEVSEPKVDEVYGCVFVDEWFRAEIVSLTPEVIVHFMDYGNTSSYDAKVFKKLPDALRSLPGLAFLIEFEEGTPNRYKTEYLEVVNFTIRETTKAFDGVPRVEIIKGKFGVTEKPLKLKKLPEKKNNISKNESFRRSIMDFIEPNSSGTMYILPGDGKVRFASIIPDNHQEAKDCSDKFLRIDISNSVPFQAEVGEYVVVTNKDGNDQRGKVVMKLASTYYVYLLDCGNIVTSESVYPLPTDLYGLLELGVKVILDEVFLENELKDIETSFYTINDAPVSGKISCFLKNFKHDVVAKAFLEKPTVGGVRQPSYIPLKSGSTVEISSISSANAFYVQSVDAEIEQKFLDMNMEMVAFASEAPSFELPPLCGELCCAKFYDDDCFYRAVINSVEKSSAWVLFVDFGNEQDTSFDDIKPLSESLKNYPFFAVKVVLKGFTDKVWNNMIKEYIMKLTSDNVELTMTYSGSISDGVILREKVSGVVVNEFMEKARDKPLEISDSNDTKKSEIFLDDDMKNSTMSVGSTCTLAILYVSKSEFEANYTFWATSTEEDNFNYVNFELSTLICEYCENVSTPYKPSYRELCLAEFEGTWYRAICIGCNGNTYKVFFVDFGNCCNLKPKSIRKIQKEFVKPPALATNCTLDVRENMKGNAELTNKICEQLMDRINTLVEGVTVLKFEEDTYVLKIPGIEIFL